MAASVRRTGDGLLYSAFVRGFFVCFASFAILNDGWMVFTVYVAGHESLTKPVTQIFFICPDLLAPIHFRPDSVGTMIVD